MGLMLTSPRGLNATHHAPDLLQPEPLSPWQATADPFQQETPNTSKASLAQSLWGLITLSLSPGVHKSFCVCPLRPCGMAFDSE